MRRLKALALCRSFLTAQTVSGKRNQVADNMNEYGITQSTGLTVYYSLDQVRFVAYYKREGGQVPLSPEIISAEIKTQIELHKGSIFPIRKFVLIIEGDADFLAEWRNSVPEIDFQICISSKETLKELGIRMIDEDWKSGTKQVSLNQLLVN